MHQPGRYRTTGGSTANASIRHVLSQDDVRLYEGVAPADALEGRPNVRRGNHDCRRGEHVQQFGNGQEWRDDEHYGAERGVDQVVHASEVGDPDLLRASMCASRIPCSADQQILVDGAGLPPTDRVGGHDHGCRSVPTTRCTGHATLAYDVFGHRILAGHGDLTIQRTDRLLRPWPGATARSFTFRPEIPIGPVGPSPRGIRNPGARREQAIERGGPRGRLRRRPLRRTRPSPGSTRGVTTGSFPAPCERVGGRTGSRREPLGAFGALAVSPRLRPAGQVGRSVRDQPGRRHGRLRPAASSDTS